MKKSTRQHGVNTCTKFGEMPDDLGPGSLQKIPDWVCISMFVGQILFFPCLLVMSVAHTHTPYSLKSNPWTTFPCLRGLCPSYSYLWSYEACPSYSWWSPKSPQDTHEFGLHHLSVSSLSKDMTNAGTTSLFNRKPLVKGHPSMIDHQFLSGFILPPTSKFRSEIIRRATYYSYSTWSEAKPYLQTDLGYSPETSPLVNNFLRSVSLLERLYLVTEIHSRSSS